MSTAAIIAELIKVFADLVVQAFSEQDPRKLKRVLDVLPPGSKLKTETVAAFEREKTRAELERQGS